MDRRATDQGIDATALRRSVQKHLEPALGGVAISGLTVADVNRWHATLLPDNPTRRSHAYRLLSAICNSAVEGDLLVKNPCQIKRAGSVKRKREPILLTIAELAAVADAIKPERFRAMVLLSAWCALRFGEVTELRRKDVGEACATITVRRAVTHRRADDGSRCRIETTKSGKGRAVVVPDHMRADLKHHLDTNVDPGPESLLFESDRKACHLSQNSFREAFNKACASIGKQGITPHALRHFGATMASRAGGTVAEVQARLGHATVRAAMAYQHATADADERLAAKLSAMAEGAS